ncbi:MAG: EamA family transporter, partial [Flavobacteriia bacterium]|nr:EamA family transporter [Flavobacteriia bacterium]
IFNQHLRSIKAIGQYSIKRWPFFLSSAIATISSYGIALWAMTVAPIGVVAALREISVLFVFLIAIFFLKEQFGKYKCIGVLLIFAGVILIKLES